MANSVNELQKQLEEWLPLKDKILARFIKGSANSTFITLTYYHDFGIVKDKVDWTGEIIEIRLNVYNRHEIKYEKVRWDSYNSLLDKWQVMKEKEISKELFDTIKSSCKSVASNLVNQIEQEIVPVFQLDNNDYDQIRAAEKQKDYFDIPYVELTQEEGWLLGKTIFMTGNYFLLTEGSMRWLEDWYEERLKWDNFGHVSCASVGERWRNSSLDRETKLKNKIKECYKKVYNG